MPPSAAKPPIMISRFRTKVRTGRRMNSAVMPARLVSSPTPAPLMRAPRRRGEGRAGRPCGCRAREDAPYRTRRSAPSCPFPSSILRHGHGGALAQALGTFDHDLIAVLQRRLDGDRVVLAPPDS